MALTLSVVAVASRTRMTALADIVTVLQERIAPYVTLKLSIVETETDMLHGVLKLKSRTAPMLILLDSRGKGFSSEGFAEWLQRRRDDGRQSIIFAIGPASGWSSETREKADLLMSLGPMTLPHELARVVLLEQVYRAFTIMAGHPYHLGH